MLLRIDCGLVTEKAISERPKGMASTIQAKSSLDRDLQKFPAAKPLTNLKVHRGGGRFRQTAFDRKLTASALIHILALGTCFVVLLGGGRRRCQALRAPFRRWKTTAQHVSDMLTPATAAVPPACRKLARIVATHERY